jgi:hypothetical protein
VTSRGGPGDCVAAMLISRGSIETITQVTRAESLRVVLNPFVHATGAAISTNKTVGIIVCTHPGSSVHVCVVLWIARNCGVKEVQETAQTRADS